MSATTYPRTPRDRGFSGRTEFRSATSEPSFRRLAAAAAPAAAITVLLFAGMTDLIKVSQLPEVQKTMRPLPPLAVPKVEITPPQIDPVPVPLAEIPLPPPPVTGNTRSDKPTMPFKVIFDPPSQVPTSKPVLRPPIVSPVVDRIAVPVREPIPDYPASALVKGLSGSCEVRFSLTSRGLPFDVSAVCSHPEFEREARRAVSKAQFLPQVRDGQAVETHNLVYPLEFTLK